MKKILFIIALIFAASIAAPTASMAQMSRSAYSSYQAKHPCLFPKKSAVRKANRKAYARRYRASQACRFR
jgi:hypothetical protein